MSSLVSKFGILRLLLMLSAVLMILGGVVAAFAPTTDGVTESRETPPAEAGVVRATPPNRARDIAVPVVARRFARVGISKDLQRHPAEGQPRTLANAGDRARSL